MLSLYEPRHGYGIMQYVKDLSKGRLSIGAGTLYGAISSLVEKGWIQECEGEDGSRKKEYTITELGMVIVEAEIERLRELLRNGEELIRGDKK